MYRAELKVTDLRGRFPAKIFDFLRTFSPVFARFRPCFCTCLLVFSLVGLSVSDLFLAVHFRTILKIFAFRQVSSTPEQPPLRTSPDPGLILSRFRSDSEPLLIRFASKRARNRIKSGSKSDWGLGWFAREAAFGWAWTWLDQISRHYSPVTMYCIGPS